MLNTGQILNNRYRIVRKIAEGGFGAIYRAWDLNLNVGCALKENIETTVAAQKQFLLEANVLATLRHPNLPRVTDYFAIADMGQFLVMDYIEGENLQEKINSFGHLPELLALKWIDQVLDALVYLHHQKPPVIHRDIKPQNIIISSTDEEQKVSLVDFGISKVFDPGLKTTIGARAVTPPFSPQEQYGRGNTDARSDIYALGATLFVSLTGVEPAESIQRTMGIDIVPPRHINSEISPLVESIVLRAMEPLPENRYQSADVFQAEIKKAIYNTSNFKMADRVQNKNEQYQSSAPTYKVPLSVPTPSVQHTSTNLKQGNKGKRRLSTRIVWAILGSIILLLFTFFAFGMRQSGIFRAKNSQSTSIPEVLYFVSTAEENKREIYKYSETGDPIRMTYSPGDSESWDPVFSPSGMMVFVSDRDGQPEIYKKSLGGKVERLTYTSEGSSFDPTFTPDGILYFCSTRGGGFGHIYAMSLDGKVERLTYGTADSIDTDPVLSPEGILYFVSNRDGNWDIFRMSIDGKTKKVTHTKDPDYCLFPSFSSSGKLFASCNIGGKMNIYEVNTTNGSLEQMTFSPEGNSSFAAIFSNNDDLYFISDRGGGSDIYMMNKSGNVTRITENEEVLMPAFSIN
jgi:serine/threonine-protein kinase